MIIFFFTHRQFHIIKLVPCWNGHQISLMWLLLQNILSDNNWLITSEALCIMVKRQSIYFCLYEINFSVGYQVTHKIIPFTRSLVMIQRQYVEWEVAKYGFKCALPIELLLYWLALERVHCIWIKNNECIHYNEWFTIKDN